MKVESVGYLAITLTFIFFYIFQDIRSVHPYIGKVYIASKMLYLLFIPYSDFWDRLKRRKEYVFDISLILLLFCMIFFHWIPSGVDKFLYFKDGVSIMMSPKTTLSAVNQIRYFDFHLWDSFTNAGSPPLTFWSTIQFHSMGLLDLILGFTSFDCLDNHELGNYLCYTFLILLVFSWICVYIFLRLLNFSRFSSYLLGLAYPFIGIFQFIELETEVVYQALIFPFIAICTLLMIRRKSISSALWLSFITAILVHYFFNFPTPNYFSQTYLFMIGWIGYMIISRKNERIKYSILLSVFIISHIFLLMPKIIAIIEYLPKLPGLLPHGYTTVSFWQKLLGLYHNIIRFFYFWLDDKFVDNAYLWYYMLTPVTFLCITGIYVLYRFGSNLNKHFDESSPAFYFLVYMVFYFFFQVIYEPSIIQAWMYKIHQIMLVHYTFNSCFTFTFCFLIISAIGLDWFIKTETQQTYIPVIIFNLLLMIIGILFIICPIGIDSQGLWRSGIRIDTKIISKMLFIAITTNIIIILLRILSSYAVLRNLVVTMLFVIYISNVLQPCIKFGEYIDGIVDNYCVTPLRYYAYYLKNNKHDIIIYEKFRKRVLDEIKDENILSNTDDLHKGDDYYNKIILNDNLFPICKNNRYSLIKLYPLPREFALYHTQVDYKNYRYSAVDYMLPHYASSPVANSFPHFLAASDDGPRCLIPIMMIPYNINHGDGWKNPRTGRTQFYFNMDLEYHLKRPYLMDILGVKYLCISKKYYDEYNIRAYDKFEEYSSFTVEDPENREIKFVKNKNAKPIAYLANDFRIMTEEEKRIDISYLRDLKLSPDIILLESKPDIEIRSRDKLDANGSNKITDTALPPVQNISTRFNWAVFGIKNNPGYNLLFHSDSYDNGWNGYVDNKMVNIFRAQLAFKAVVVPPGDHIVWFEYRPYSFVLGLYIFCLTILAIAIFNIKKFNSMNKI